MTPDTIVDVYCEICEERIAQIRVGDLKYPMTGGMFLSPDEHHGYPAPFDPGTDWEFMRCPHCRFRPFLLDDRINAGDRYIYARREDQEDTPETVDGILQAIGPEEAKLLTCDICGKQFTPMQMGLHKNNHRRTEKKKARERGRK